MDATVVRVVVEAGQVVRSGQTLLVLESMKMEHQVQAPDLAAVGTAAGPRPPSDGSASDGRAGSRAQRDVRPDLAEVQARHAHGLDANRPEATARRARLGLRTARANVDDLCDPGTLVEYGPLVVAAQRGRRPLDELIEQTPGDGLVAGVARVQGRRCAVLAYDATVLAGTQGLRNHQKTDRLLDVADTLQAPLVLFAEGGGGRPGDTDMPVVAGLDLMTFHRFAALSGRVPLVGIAAGRCFAGNAALLGCCDVIIATRDVTIGMGGPAMVEGGGLGVYRPEQIGPAPAQTRNGVIDVLVDDEEQAVAVAKRYLGYACAGLDADAAGSWTSSDQEQLRDLVPLNRVQAYDVRAVIDVLADADSVLELRPDFGTGIVTAFVRIEGRPHGLVANSSEHLGGAIDADGAVKASRFLRLCDSYRLPVVSLCDTPGFMVGPDAEATGTVRHFGDLFVAGARLSVPVVTIVLRKAYGLGAMAMAAGGLKVPVATAAWPTAEFGAMGLEGAVKLGFRRELEAIDDPAERQRVFDEMVAASYEHGKAVNAASMFEVDAVIDPVDTRRWITAVTADEPARAPVPTARDIS